MFSSEFFSSISLATVTPSLVIVGDPNFLSRMTLRPFGPSVTFTASAKRLTPRRMPCREESPYAICFAMTLSPVAQQSAVSGYFFLDEVILLPVGLLFMVESSPYSRFGLFLQIRGCLPPLFSVARFRVLAPLA